MRILVLALLCLPLAGCFGLTWPPPPLPDWAMSPHAEVAAPTRASATRRASSQRGRSQIGTNPARDDILPFTPEWQAREDAFDAQLRRSMNICRGC